MNRIFLILEFLNFGSKPGFDLSWKSDVDEPRPRKKKIFSVLEKGESVSTDVIEIERGDFLKCEEESGR